MISTHQKKAIIERAIELLQREDAFFMCIALNRAGHEKFGYQECSRDIEELWAIEHMGSGAWTSAVVGGEWAGLTYPNIHDRLPDKGSRKPALLHRISILKEILNKLN